MTGLIPPEEMTRETGAPQDEPVADAAADEIGAVRELILRTHADAVPELIGGATIAELIASIAPAQDVYARIAAQVGDANATTTVPAVPAGGAGPAPVDPHLLSAGEKIRRGIAGR